MKPAPFTYRRAASVAEACAWLAADPEARPIAGGQTLMPMLAMRLARPTQVIDIARIPGLDGIAVEDAGVTLGATLTQAAALSSAPLRRAAPLLARALPFVGHPPTRRRGTIGGSLANADPAAEIPLVAVTLGGSIMLAGAEAAAVPAAEFFLAPMVTALPPGALLLGLRLPAPPAGRRGHGFREVAMRQGDYALAAAACSLALDAAGRCTALALGIGGATPVPTRLALDGLLGSDLPPAAVREAVAAALAPLEMLHDPNAGAAYRRRAALALACQAVAEARAEALACA